MKPNPQVLFCRNCKNSMLNPLKVVNPPSSPTIKKYFHSMDSGSSHKNPIIKEPTELIIRVCVKVELLDITRF
jgi:hypothetical protein